MTGKEVKAKIKAKGYKYAEVARVMGRSKQNFAMLVRNDAPVSTTTLEMIARAIGEPVSYFYDEDMAQEIARLRVEVRNLQIKLKEVQNVDLTK